ncbi:hypothetical protein BPS26883_04683 [Burkholderia pseudomultivorans]|uniref:Uncharacterized protein n=1 Tax=Burkholderia pseudomultivorans TaxID=1207504 RepID=A0A6P2NQ26_9BURK|nr:hypothetical protein [Burkholderia pseudomultivorans]VWB96789.1 hypothetical protein BPS26883_04683 [Burkholderia pseudomultivorans]
MTSENISVIELLDRADRFEAFAEGLLERGWVTDDELGLTRVAFRYAPEGDELRPLVAKYGFDEIQDLRLLPMAFRQRDGYFLYLFYDAQRYESFEELRAALRKSGFDVLA